jgi:CIC family chloride channel protein
MNRIQGEELGTQFRRLFRLRVWAGERLRLSDLQVTLLWAAAIGLLGALAAALFRAGLEGIADALSGGTGGVLGAFGRMPRWQRLLVPIAGGLAAGVVLVQGRRLGRSEKSSDYMEAIVVGDGHISFRTSIVKSVSSLLSGASGASIGHEGAMVQLSSMLASLVGRARSFSLPMRRQMVACGAAAGIASAYNAPIAGSFFVAEIVLGSLSMEYFGPMVISSVIATLVTRSLRGGQALYEAPPFQARAPWELVAYLLLGIGCGLLAPFYVRVLRGSERAFGRLPIPPIVRLGLGGVVVGSLALAYPEVCGNGYVVVQSILHGRWLWSTLALILAFKLLATAATFGSGAVGGVFTPTLVVGSALGYLFGTVTAAIVPHAGLEPSAYALVGMGAFLAAATGAPIMAVIMLFELTLNYLIILPLMLACVVAYYTARTSQHDTLYAAVLARKGAAAVAERLTALRAGDLMRPNPEHVRTTATFREIAAAFLANHLNHLYVIDAGGRFVGVVALHDVKGYLDQPELARLLIAEDIMHEDFPRIMPESGLEEALRSFERIQSERIPVVKEEANAELVGSLSKTDLLRHMAGHGRRR